MGSAVFSLFFLRSNGLMTPPQQRRAVQVSQWDLIQVSIWSCYSATLPSTTQDFCLPCFPCVLPFTFALGDEGLLPSKGRLSETGTTSFFLVAASRSVEWPADNSFLSFFSRGRAMREEPLLFFSRNERGIGQSTTLRPPLLVRTLSHAWMRVDGQAASEPLHV